VVSTAGVAAPGPSVVRPTGTSALLIEL